MRPLIIGAAVALTVVGCASSGTTSVKPAAAIPSGLPLGCVPNAQTQKCDQFGTYYSGDDLRRTGAQHVGQALTLVDPQLGH
ncbi:MAG TPA: hypothetical protein VNY70_05600 [Steroidobacteraceae bacterium]|jgi:hypothetical protein|nr:hypothetical protein [Steroidobacteraceae bacterium]